jgi:tetratricopeptide (TPR) repeat protein
MKDLLKTWSRWVVCLILVPGLLSAQDVNTESAGARAQFVMGMKAFDMGDNDAARKHWDKAIQLDPEFAAPHTYLMWVATSVEDWQGHYDRAKALRDGASVWVQHLIDQATAGINSDSRKAMQIAHSLVTMYPSSARAYHYLSFQYTNQKMYEAARGVMKTALALDPHYVPAYSGLANSYIFNEPADLEMAKKYAKKYVKLAAEAPNSYVVLGDVHRAMNDFEKASQMYAMALEVDPTDATVYSKKGHSDTFSGDFEAARAAYASAAENATSLAAKSTHRNFSAYTHLYEGDAAAAMEANQAVIDGLLSATEGDPNFALRVTYGDRALIAMHHDMLDEAEDAVKERMKWTEKIIAQVTETEWTNSLMAGDVLLSGMIAVRKGDLDDARKHADKYKQLRAEQTSERRYEDLHRLLGLIELADGNGEGAVSHLEQADRESMFVKYELGEAHEAAGNKEAAMKLYEEIANYNFNGVGPAICRGMAKEKLAM